MNWIGIVILAICLVYGLIGYHKGFAKMVISTVSVILIMIGAALLEPFVANVLTEYTSIDESIEKTCRDVITDRVSDWRIEERTEQIAFIENLTLCETVKADMIEDNNRVVYEHLQVSTFTEYLSSYLAGTILAAIAYLLAFVIMYVVVQLIIFCVTGVSEAPVIGFVNRIAGFGLGFIKGMLFVCVLELVLMMMSHTPVGQEMTELMLRDPIGSVFYEKNPLVEILLHIIKK